jgi:hypothetical protein
MPVIDTIKRTLGLGESTAQPTATSSSSSPAVADTPVPTAAPPSQTTQPAPIPAVTSTSDEKPVYSAKEVTVLFVLGGPGVGELLSPFLLFTCCSGSVGFHGS